MKKYIIGNLKMNLLPKDTQNYCYTLKENISNRNCSVGIALPYTSLLIGATSLTDSKILLGAQNLHYEESGSWTGEVSSEMIKECGCSFCIVGHSERRQKFGETNAFINKKIKALLKKGIKVVLCVGETAGENENGKTKQVLNKQLHECLDGLYENELKSIMIAYEPIWAIGTGKTPTPKQIEKIVANIRLCIQNSYSSVAAEKITILYGGSVKKENIKAFTQTKGVDGTLVGGASNDAKEFSQLINLV